MVTRIRKLLPVALLALHCASATTTPPLRIDINGQTIDRQFRELVVRATNDGTDTLRGLRLEVTLPESLAVIGNGQHAERMELRRTKLDGSNRVYAYALPPLAPGTTAAAHFPFRTQALAALEGHEIHVVARLGSAKIETKRIF